MNITSQQQFFVLTIAMGFLAGSGGFFWFVDLSLKMALIIGLIVAVMTTNILNSYERRINDRK